MWGLVNVRVEAKDFEANLYALIPPFLRRKPCNDYWFVVDSQPLGGYHYECVLEPFQVVSLWEVIAEMATAALLAVQSRKDDYLSGGQHIQYLKCFG